MGTGSFLQYEKQPVRKKVRSKIPCCPPFTKWDIIPGEIRICSVPVPEFYSSTASSPLWKRGEGEIFQRDDLRNYSTDFRYTALELLAAFTTIPGNDSRLAGHLIALNLSWVVAVHLEVLLAFLAYIRFSQPPTKRASGLPHNMTIHRSSILRALLPSSSSSRVFGQSAFSKRDSDRSASNRPSVWHRAQ
jgi:hypothetical protein